MDVKSKVLKIRNLPCDGKKLDTISSKPYGFICVLLIAGIILLCSNYYLVGCVITIFSAYYLFFVKNIKLVEFFDRYALFYMNNGKDECFVLFWEDVDHWEFSKCKNDLDSLTITLKNHQSVSIKCVSRKKIEKYLTECTTQKDTCQIHKQHA